MTKSNHMYSTIRKVLLLSVLGLFFCVPSVYGTSSEPTVTLTLQEYNTLQQNFTTLENIIDNQLNTINELETQLSLAKASTSEQQQMLNELLNLLKEQRQELTEAKNSLEMQNKTLLMQKESLAKAEAYLKMQEREIKKAQQSQRRARLINILLGAGVIYLASR
jgi:hypothetical protein